MDCSFFFDAPFLLSTLTTLTTLVSKCDPLQQAFNLMLFVMEFTLLYIF